MEATLRLLENQFLDACMLLSLNESASNRDLLRTIGKLERLFLIAKNLGGNDASAE